MADLPDVPKAPMLELEDKHASEACVERREGSNPPRGTLAGGQARFQKRVPQRVRVQLPLRPQKKGPLTLRILYFPIPVLFDNRFKTIVRRFLFKI